MPCSELITVACGRQRWTNRCDRPPAGRRGSSRDGCCRRPCLDWGRLYRCWTSRARLCSYVHQRSRHCSVRVIAGVIGGIADLGTVTGAPRRGRDGHLYGDEAFVEAEVPDPLAAEFLRCPLDSGAEHPDIDVTRSKPAFIAGGLGFRSCIRPGQMISA